MVIVSVCYLYGEGRVCLSVCAAVWNETRCAFGVGAADVSAAKTAVGKHKEDKMEIFMQRWDNEDILAVILVGDVCFDYFTVQTNEV